MSFEELKQHEQSRLVTDFAENLLVMQSMSESDDDLSSPECLLQPVGDDYSSDDSLCNPSNKDKIVTCSRSPLYLTEGNFISRKNDPVHNSCDLTIGFLEKKLNACFSTGGKGQKFMERNNLSLKECLGEMLDFSLEMNDRKTLVEDGTMLFDGFCVEEIVSMWKRFNPCLKWLLENFNFNIPIISEMTQICADTGEKILALDTKRKQMFCFHYNMPDAEAQQQLTVTNRCLQFAKRFIDKMDQLYEPPVGTEPVEQDDPIEPILNLLTNITDLQYKLNGECKLSTNISVVGPCRINTVPVVTRPDFIFMNSREDIQIPVQINKKDPPMDENAKNHQMQQTEKLSRAQHLMQHIALMSKILDSASLNDDKYLDKLLVSVGLCWDQDALHFTKVQTSPAHMSSFLLELLPGGKNQSVTNLAIRMNQRRVKDGINETKSNWSLDLHKGVHRNALLVFLVHYLYGLDCSR